jgi:hypothetical protein
LKFVKLKYNEAMSGYAVNTANPIRNGEIYR